MLLVLLAAVFLRLHDIASVPPGLTHDEADHGITAWSIVDEGVRDIYFTVGYGREPLYDYVTALMMTFLGPTFMAGRLTAVYFSLILFAGLASWVRRAFDRQTAMLTAAGLAVAFWPVMAGRQALRSILLPALFALAVAIFWHGLELASPKESPQAERGRRSWMLFIGAGLLLGLTFYAYIPARVLWTIFPTLLVYLFFSRRALFKLVWSRTLLMLLMMAVVATPLLLFLGSNSTAEVRIQQLATPLTAALGGEFGPLLQNITGSLRLFFIEGDMTWRYNIAGRPLLGPFMGVLFMAGLLLALWYSYKRRHELRYGAASFLALSWFAAGFLPVLVTGPELSMTQAIGMQPVLYLFPALSLLALGRIPWAGKQLAGSRWATVGLILLFVIIGAVTYRDYFITWANSPEVRVQYESTMATAMKYLNDQGEGIAAISSISPDRYHSPALAQMLLHNDGVEARWFDGRSSILLPKMETGLVMIPGFTPMPEILQGFFSKALSDQSLPLRETDLDRPLDIYKINHSQMSDDWQKELSSADAEFGAAVQLLGYALQAPQAAPGEDVQIVTLWRARRPVEDAMLFVHVVAPEGEPVAQADQIGVPSYAWQEGDLFLQMHQFTLPADTPAGNYPLAVGVYKQADGSRLTLTGGSQSGDIYTFSDLAVKP
jgi:hypothetical protein